MIWVWCPMWTVFMIVGREEGPAATVDRPGRAVAAHRAPAAQGRAAQPTSTWSQPIGRPQGAVRDPVRGTHRHQVGVPTAGVEVRVGHDLLAALGRMEPR